MADTYIKISELEETTLADDSSYIPIDNGNHTYKISVENYNSGANATAKSYAEAAEASADDAETAKTAAETAETETGLIRTATQQYATAASGSASAAASSAVDALNYADSAASAAANAADSAQDAAESYTNATEKAVLSESWAVGGTNTRTGEDTNNSQYYAAVAKSAAENAEDQVELANAASQAASGSAVDAAASATEASGYAGDASDSASDASTSASAAATQATNAANSAGAAATSATNAAASATAASGSASTATTQATNAAQSATTAGGYATQAASSASDASGYATNAANSATAAAGSATTASNQATAAAGSATAAASSASDAADSAADAAESAATFTTDDTLSIAGKAADAKAAGDMIAAVQAEIPELDNWLTTPGAAAEAKHTGDRITEVEDDVADLKSAIDGGTTYQTVVPQVVTGVAINGISGKESATTAYNATAHVAIPEGATSVALTASYSDSLGMMFYTSQGTAISGSGVYGSNASTYGGTNKSAPQTLTIPIPTNAATLRASIRTAYYTQPSDIGIVYAILRESIYDKIDDLKTYVDTSDATLSTSIKAIADTHFGKNLVNPATETTGAIQSDGTISVSGSFANYSTSDFIPVSAGISYHLGIFGANENYYSAGRKLYLLYTAEKAVISGSFVNTTSEAVITPVQDGYIRVSWASVNLVMLIVGTAHIAYEAYSNQYLLNNAFPLTAEMESQIAHISGNVLSAKKWAHCGDSFSDYTNKTFSSGAFSGKYASFPRLIAERNGMDLLQDFMLSGRTLAFPANPGTFVNALTCPTQSFYYQNIPADVDYVTIMLGINDCQHTGSGSTGEITLGTIDDTTTATYYGAYNTVCAWLRENRPFAHVGIVITNGTTRQDYTEAQIAIAKKWGYPYINLNGDERTPAFIRCYNPNLPTALKDSLKTIQGVDAPSNTHPNWQTHELESTIIEAWLRSL